MITAVDLSTQLFRFIQLIKKANEKGKVLKLTTIELTLSLIGYRYQMLSNFM